MRFEHMDIFMWSAAAGFILLQIVIGCTFDPGVYRTSRYLHEIRLLWRAEEPRRFWITIAVQAAVIVLVLGLGENRRERERQIQLEKILKELDRR